MYKKEKKIPTLLALFLLFFGIGVTVYLDRSSHLLTSSAKTVASPEDVHFTNISDNSFVVSWFTATPNEGWVKVSGDSISLTLLDDLDSDNISRPRNTHYVTVKNLQENSSYTVKIISGDARCLKKEACLTLAQKTASKLLDAFSLPPAKGKLITQTNDPAEGAIVYLTINNSLPLSGRVDSSGLWVIPLTGLRVQDYLNRPYLADDDLIQIVAKLDPNQISQALIDLKSIRQNLTIPPMQIGNSYNFINLISKQGSLALNANQKILGTQTEKVLQTSLSPFPPENKVIDVFFPTDGGTTPDNQPRIRGSGIPGSILTIIINSSPQTAKITVGKDGTWNYRPKKILPPGSHQITVQGYDQKGKRITLLRKFTVLKSGEQVLGEATASATLTPVLSPTDTPIPSPLPSVIPSTTISFPPTAIPVSLTTSPAPPPTGTTKPLLILFATAATLVALGTKLLLLP